MTPAPSDHFNGKTFFNRDHVNRDWLDVLRWRLTSRGELWPRRVEIAPQPPPPAPRGDEIVATWINHATYLLQTTRGNFLTDPVFCERASPFQWGGPQRVHPPGIAPDALPKIDFVLLSHDHYDHCDIASLQLLATKHDPLFVAPLQHADLLARAGARHVVELDWWQAHAVAGTDVRITLTPARHWSNRLSSKRNSRLWGGFVVLVGARQFYFVGDSGYDDRLFRAIRERCGAPDLALIPIGAYEPRWFMSAAHMNPPESVAAHREVGARQSVAMHWGCWQLTDEAREAPVRALETAKVEAGVAPAAFRVLEPGGSLVV